MQCPNCRLENPSGALRCDCGYAFSQLDGETRRCPSCAETINAAAQKCRYCGESLITRRRSLTSPTLGAIVLMCAIAVACIIYFAQRGSSFVERPSSSLLERRSTSQVPIVTRADYERIEKGMSYDQVKTIIGIPGTEISAVRIWEVRLRSCTRGRTRMART